VPVLAHGRRDAQASPDVRDASLSLLLIHALRRLASWCGGRGGLTRAGSALRRASALVLVFASPGGRCRFAFLTIGTSRDLLLRWL